MKYINFPLMSWALLWLALLTRLFQIVCSPFSTIASDWLAAVLPANQKLCKKMSLIICANLPLAKFVELLVTHQIWNKQDTVFGSQYISYLKYHPVPHVT